MECHLPQQSDFRFDHLVHLTRAFARVEGGTPHEDKLQKEPGKGDADHHSRDRVEHPRGEGQGHAWVTGDETIQNKVGPGASEGSSTTYVGRVADSQVDTAAQFSEFVVELGHVRLERRPDKRSPPLGERVDRTGPAPGRWCLITAAGEGPRGHSDLFPHAAQFVAVVGVVLVLPQLDEDGVDNGDHESSRCGVADPHGEEHGIDHEAEGQPLRLGAEQLHHLEGYSLVQVGLFDCGRGDEGAQKYHDRVSHVLETHGAGREDAEKRKEYHR